MINQYKTNKTKTGFLNSLKEILIPFDEDYSELHILQVCMVKKTQILNALYSTPFSAIL